MGETRRMRSAGVAAVLLCAIATLGAAATPAPWLRETVTVTAGQLRDVPVTFAVPPYPVPVDVYFLVDTTGGMDPAVRGLRDGIANIASRLHRTFGEGACLGLGNFRDFIAGDPNHNYVRDVPITCADPVAKIGAALAAWPPQAGGGDAPEAQTIALTQSVTGTGQMLPDPPVDRNQQAGFRPGAHTVIVLISDSGFHQGSGYPTTAATIQTLNVAHVAVVGALVETGGDQYLARSDMEKVAGGTRALAPAGGVDCDANGHPSMGDVAPGAPLVCDVGGGSAVDLAAIPGLVAAAVHSPRFPTMSVDVTDDHGVVRGMTHVVTEPGRIRFVLQVTCTRAQVGLDLPVGLTFHISGVASVPRGLVVGCREGGSPGVHARRSATPTWQPQPAARPRPARSGPTPHLDAGLPQQRDEQLAATNAARADALAPVVRALAVALLLAVTAAFGWQRRHVR